MQARYYAVSDFAERFNSLRLLLWETVNHGSPDWQLDLLEGVLEFQIQNDHEPGFFQGQLSIAFRASVLSDIAFEE